MKGYNSDFEFNDANHTCVYGFVERVLLGFLLSFKKIDLPAPIELNF